MIAQAGVCLTEARDELITHVAERKAQGAGVKQWQPSFAQRQRERIEDIAAAENDAVRVEGAGALDAAWDVLAKYRLALLLA